MRGLTHTCRRICAGVEGVAYTAYAGLVAALKIPSQVQSSIVKMNASRASEMVIWVKKHLDFSNRR